MSTAGPLTAHRPERVAVVIPAKNAAERIEAIQAAVEADATRLWQLDLADLTLVSEQDSWDVALDSGPGEMLRSGRWDATSQLLDHGPDVDALMQQLPYLNGFAPE